MCFKHKCEYASLIELLKNKFKIKTGKCYECGKRGHNASECKVKLVKEVNKLKNKINRIKDEMSFIPLIATNRTKKDILELKQNLEIKIDENKKFFESKYNVKEEVKDWSRFSQCSEETSTTITGKPKQEIKINKFNEKYQELKNNNNNISKENENKIIVKNENKVRIKKKDYYYMENLCQALKEFRKEKNIEREKLIKKLKNEVEVNEQALSLGEKIYNMNHYQNIPGLTFKKAKKYAVDVGDAIQDVQNLENFKINSRYKKYNSNLIICDEIDNQIFNIVNKKNYLNREEMIEVIENSYTITLESFHPSLDVDKFKKNIELKLNKKLQLKKIDSDSDDDEEYMYLED